MISQQQTFLSLPTRWRRKPAGIHVDMERNYVTVTLCVPDELLKLTQVKTRRLVANVQLAWTRKTVHIFYQTAELATTADSGRRRQIPVLNGVCHLQASVRRRMKWTADRRTAGRSVTVGHRRDATWPPSSQASSARRRRKKLQGSFIYFVCVIRGVRDSRWPTDRLYSSRLQLDWNDRRCRNTVMTGTL